jgi:hypothetical protein
MPLYLTGSGTSANGSTIGTHPPIGPNSTEGAHTIPDIARPHIGGHGAPDSKRYGSVTSGTQARQMRDTPDGWQETNSTYGRCTFGAVHKGLKGSLLPTSFPVSEAKPLWRSPTFTR